MLQSATRWGIAAFCAITLASPGWSVESRTSAIRLSSVTLDTAQARPVIPEHLRAEGAARQILLVKFPAPPTAEQLRGLEAATSRIYTYLPDFAFLVRVPELQNLTALTALGAQWTEPYHPAFKISPAAMALAAADDELVQELTGQARQSVLLHIFPDADLDQVHQRLRSLGVPEAVGERRRGSFARLRLLLTPGELSSLQDELARMPEVFYIDQEARRVLLNDTTIWVCQSGTSGGQTTPVFDHGLFGAGQVVGVLDTGIDPDMCYFRDTALGLPPINVCDGGTAADAGQRKVVAVDFLAAGECAGGISATEWDTHDHGSHVAGTVAGDDFANSPGHDPGDGMAPLAKLVIQDGGFAADNCADLPGLGCPVVDLVPIFQQAYDQGARIHTNSWGDRENFTPHNTYTAGSEDVDEFMWNHKDFLLFFAAGNDGPSNGTVGSPTTAKNLVSVGATQRSSLADSIASFSSCGPTADGRIKPDVTAPGVSIVSANNDLNIGTNNCGTRTMSGTSMASPAAAGLGALVRQYFTDGFYPSGGAQGGDAFIPSAALVKATLVSSATSMTNVSAIPSTCQGWGRILLDNALFFPGDSRKLWVKDEVAGFPGGSSGTTFDYAFTVSSGVPLKVTLGWTDYPSTPAAATNLVNDLDLEVSGPGGTYLGNVFAGGASSTGGSPDRLNNLEQVLLLSPAAGTYTVTVRSFNVPQGPQDFALVVTGDATPGGPCSATCGNGVIECAEVCDGAALGGQTCASFGCAGGTLACAAGCGGFDLAGCFGCPACDNDGVCELGEDCGSCPGDCVSGSAPGAACGNGVCEAGDGEDCLSCPADCNGVQGGKPANRYCCGDGDGSNPISCGDSRCTAGGKGCTTVPTLPGGFCCGLGGCETGESCGNCALDCATGAEVCNDDADNDCDGATDCADSDCLSDPVCQTPTCSLPGAACISNSECCSNSCKGKGGSKTCN